MLHELANGDGYVAFKWAADNREGCQEPAIQLKTVDDDGLFWDLLTLVVRETGH